MSKRFYFRLPVTREKVIVTVDDDDAYRLRSEHWLVRNNKGLIELNRFNNGCLLMFGRVLLGVTADGVCVAHKNGDSSDYRKENLVKMTRAEFNKMFREKGNAARRSQKH